MAQVQVARTYPRGVLPLRRDVLAWVVAGSAIAVGVGAQALVWLDGTDALLRIVGGFVALVVPFAVIGGLLASRLTDNRIGWLFLALASLAAGAQFADAYATRGLVTAPGTLPGARELALVADLTWWVPLVVLLTWVVLLFPDGRPPAPAWRLVSWAAGASLLVVLSTLAVAGWPTRGATFTHVDDTGLPGWAALVAGGGGLALIASMLASLTSLGVRFRHARGVERAQLRWFLVGSVLAALGVAALMLAGPFGVIGGLVGIAALPTAAATAILRYRLYSLDLLVNRSLVWSILTALVVAAYLAVAGSVALLVGQRASSAWVAVVTAVVVTASFGPVRGRVQLAVNRLTFGDQADPYRVLAGLTRRLESATATRDVLAEAVTDIARSLRWPYVAVHQSTGGRPGQLLAATGEPSAGHVLELRHGGRVVGELTVGGRGPGAQLAERDRTLLADVANQLALLVHATSLSSELERAHRRLLDTREVERRRLRDDLHDGLGPSLAAIAAGIEAARYELDEPRPFGEEVTDLLDRTLREVDHAIASTRAIVRGLRPPLLDELGLAEALRERCARPGPTRFDVDVAAAELDTLPAAIEVAVLHVVEEAVTNVVRHANARHGVVQLSLGDRDGPALRIAIADDGCGLPAAGFEPGVGLHSMRRRVAELGGHLDVQSPPGGGTRVVAWLPVQPTT